MMKQIPLTHFYMWGLIRNELIANIMQEFADNGAEYLVFNENFGIRLATDESFEEIFLNAQKSVGIPFFECHGPYSRIYDLNEMEARQQMIAAHKKVMAFVADLGCKTYTVHIGHTRAGKTVEELREYTLDSLEQLLPTAEKLNLIIAVENATVPTNTPDEVLFYLNHFQTPSIGCCLDTGHANILTAGPGKVIEKFSAGIQKEWQGREITLYDDVVAKLAPHIVTTHLHDNNGFVDSHMLPGTGTIDWSKLLPQLRNCPRIVSMQNETSPYANHLSIRKMCETVNQLVKTY